MEEESALKEKLVKNPFDTVPDRDHTVHVQGPAITRLRSRRWRPPPPIVSRGFIRRSRY